MNDLELISVIVPVYNIENYLLSCLKSIAAQSYSNIEIILVDDGSTDSSGTICDQFAETDNRVKVIHQNNKGLWAARNAGQEKAEGDYLWFPDGDDYYHLDFLRTMYDAINNNKADLAICAFKRSSNYNPDDINSLLCNRIVDVKNQDELIKSLFINNNEAFNGFIWNRLYRKRLINPVHNHNYKRAQDWDFNFRTYLLAKKGVYVDQVLYFWVQRPDSLVHRPEHMQILYKCREEIYLDNFLNLPESQKKYARYLLDSLYAQTYASLEFAWGQSRRKSLMKHRRIIIKKTILPYLLSKGSPIVLKAKRICKVIIPDFVHYYSIFHKSFIAAILS